MLSEIEEIRTTIEKLQPELYATEGVMPMLLTTNRVQHLEYVPISRIKPEHGGLPIRLGDVLSALGEATQTINKLQEDNARLQAENERLWRE